MNFFEDVWSFLDKIRSNSGVGNFIGIRPIPKVDVHEHGNWRVHPVFVHFCAGFHDEFLRHTEIMISLVDEFSFILLTCRATESTIAGNPKPKNAARPKISTTPMKDQTFLAVLEQLQQHIFSNFCGRWRLLTQTNVAPSSAKTFLASNPQCSLVAIRLYPQRHHLSAVKITQQLSRKPFLNLDISNYVTNRYEGSAWFQHIWT